MGIIGRNHIKAFRIGSIPFFYLGEDGSIFEVENCNPNGLFNKYHQVLGPTRRSLKDNYFTYVENLGRIHNLAIKLGPILSGPQRITLEGEWTENLKGLVNDGNRIVMRSISYRLAEKAENIDMEIFPK